MEVDPGRQKITLSRDLSLFTITMIGVRGMIGAGIFVLSVISAGVAGHTEYRMCVAGRGRAACPDALGGIRPA